MKIILPRKEVSTEGGAVQGGFFVYQSDGNLVIYNSAWQAVWASNTDRG
jgi:hypothetical protein